MTNTVGGPDAVHQACAHVLDIELTAPVVGLLRTTPKGPQADSAWALVRLFGEPLGLDVLDIPPEGLTSEAVEALVLDRRLTHLAQLLGIDGGKADRDTVREAARTMGGTAFSRAHAEFVVRAPRCSVIVCSRERPDDLRRCLDSLTVQDHPNFAVWVIDNAPLSGNTRRVVESFGADLDIHYVVEPRPGLSRARNTGLRSELEGDVVAWLDDDEVADPLWLSELARAFDARPDVVAASGAVIPAELSTRAQLWFEQFGGHSKGRGFTAEEFSPRTWSKQHPLYPLPPFGVGANMAFRTETLCRLGGFDVALGSGTPAGGAEDTKMFTDLLRAGGTVAYRPAALTRHFHRRGLEGLRRQMRGYGSGLTAFYTASVLARPSTTVDLVRLAPRASRDLCSSDSVRVATLEDDFPRDLLAENRRGLVAGPWLYLRGRVQSWRADRRVAGGSRHAQAAALRYGETGPAFLRDADLPADPVRPAEGRPPDQPGRVCSGGTARRGRNVTSGQPFEALLTLLGTGIGVWKGRFRASSLAPRSGLRALTLLKDPALRGAFALMFSAVMAGGLGFVFWSLIARRQDAYAVGSVAGEVSSITFLATVGSLNLINVFARFLPEAGRYARRLILVSYGGAALVGLLVAVAFLLTPMAAGLVLGGGLGRLAFAVCVVLNSVFMIQDGGLVGFGRFGWVPVENVLVASARLALLPLAATFLSAPIGILWSWALPMAVAVLVVNVLIIGRLASQQAKQHPSLPTFGQLGRFVAIDSVTAAVASAVSAFLPALVTQRLGASQGGYFYVPWVIAMMVGLLLCNIALSMVREAVANPEKADSAIRRSTGLALLVVIAAMMACLLLPGLLLAPLGPDFAAHGAPLLRWIGLAVPASAVNILYWATCLVRRRPWPVFTLNLATSGAIVGGVLLLGRDADISRVGIIFCLVQWVVAAAVSLPTMTALRVIRQRQEQR